MTRRLLSTSAMVALTVATVLGTAGATGRFNPQAQPVPIPGGFAPVGVAFNHVTGKLYVANAGSDNVSVLEEVRTFGAVTPTLMAQSSGAMHEFLRNIRVGEVPSDIAVNPLTNRIYVSHYGVPERPGATVAVIDGNSDELIATIPTGGFMGSGIAVNPATNKIYVVNYGGGDVSVIDGSTHIVTLVPVGASPVGIAVNSTTNRIWVSNQGDANSPSSISVISGDTNAVTTVNDDTSINPGLRAIRAPWGIAVDESTNTFFVVMNIGWITKYDGSPSSPSGYIEVLPSPCGGTKPCSSTGPNASSPRGVALDITRQRIWVVAHGVGRLLGYNLSNKSLIASIYISPNNPCCSASTPVFGGSGGNAVSVNTDTGGVYLASKGPDNDFWLHMMRNAAHCPDENPSDPTWRCRAFIDGVLGSSSSNGFNYRNFLTSGLFYVQEG